MYVFVSHIYIFINLQFSQPQTHNSSIIRPHYIEYPETLISFNQSNLRDPYAEITWKMYTCTQISSEDKAIAFSTFSKKEGNNSKHSRDTGIS